MPISLFFLSDHIIGQLDFQAEDVDRALEIAEIMFDACSDRCQSWQVWVRDVFLAGGHELSAFDWALQISPSGGWRTPSSAGKPF
jgi:hypothetical protein